MGAAAETTRCQYELAAANLTFVASVLGRLHGGQADQPNAPTRPLPEPQQALTPATQKLEEPAAAQRPPRGTLSSERHESVGQTPATAAVPTRGTRFTRS